MKKLLNNALLVVLLSITALFIWQNHQLKQEKAILQTYNTILEHELKVEKQHHETDLRSSIMHIQQLEKRIEALQASTN